jgi:hypothetical protein
MNTNRSLADKIGALSEQGAVDQTNMPEDYIVQNVTLGPHFVSDIRLNVGPLEAVDLTWEDPRIIKASNHLKASIRYGILRRITREQFDAIEDRKIARERETLRKSQKNRRLNTVTDADGNQRIAETIDASKPYQKGEAVTVEGYANDSFTYALALDIAQAEAHAQGYELSVEEFAQRASSDPNYIPRLVKANSSAVSGDPRRGRAVFAEAPSGNSFDGTSVRTAQMTNFNNDGYIAGDIRYNGGVDVDMDADEDMGIAHEIDLTEEVESAAQQEKGAIKRKR